MNEGRTLIALAILGLAFLWVLWAFYVLIMGLYRAHLAGRLTWIHYALSLPFLVVGFAVDVLVNLLIASVIFLELPSELLLTKRLQRHLGSTSWRGRLAKWICAQLLDVFDPTGAHCD